MGLGQDDIEGAVRALFAFADPPHSLDLPGNPFQLALDLKYEVVHDPTLRRKAVLVPRDDDPSCRGLLRVQPGLDLLEKCFVIAHEIAEDYWRREKHRGPTIEHDSNRLARALKAPRPAFTAAFEDLGVDLDGLGIEFQLSQVEVARRIGETTDKPIAIVQNVDIEYSDASVFPSERELRAIVRRGGDLFARVHPVTDRTAIAVVVGTRRRDT